MVDIPGGSDLIRQSTDDPDCRECRTRICNRNNFGAEGIGATVILGSPFGRFDDEAGKIAMDHLASCSACQSWFRSILPKGIMERYERMKHYCCPSMYCAVEEFEELYMPRFQFRHFKDDDTFWEIEGKTNASFCPWCGKRLPDGPFRTPA